MKEQTEELINNITRKKDEIIITEFGVSNPKRWVRTISKSSPVETFYLDGVAVIEFYPIELEYKNENNSFRVIAKQNYRILVKKENTDGNE